MSDDFRGKGGSPWGAPPGGGSGNGSGRGPTPPNIDELIKDIQDKIKKFLPGGKTSGGKSISLILLVSPIFLQGLNESLNANLQMFLYIV